MNKRGRNSSEINLTPLLDVLFVILFSIMLSNNVAAQNSVNQANEENKSLRTENKGYEDYEKEVVVITVVTYKKDNAYYLKVTNNRESEPEPINVGKGRYEKTKEWFQNYMNDITDKYKEEPIMVECDWDNSATYDKDKESILTVLNNCEKNVFIREVSSEGE